MNTLKLKALMMVSRETQASIAEKIGMSRMSLNLKLNGKSEFTLFELQKIVGVLEMTDSQILEIFFKRKENK